MKRITFLFFIIALLFMSASPFAPTAFAAGPEWVVVNPGETLTSIALRYGVSVEALIRANNLPNPNFVYSGQRLLIPDPLMTFPNAPAQANASAASAPSQQVVYYTVRPGDTLAAIAQRHGVSIAAIAQANNLTNWNFVWYGQRLKIPGAAMPAPQNTAPNQPIAPPPHKTSSPRPRP